MKILIGPFSFEISAPFAEGHPCTAAEAQALNALRGVNIRRAIWNKAARHGQQSEAEFEALVRQYDESYQFTARRERDGRFARLDIEARLVAEAEADVEFRRARRATDNSEFEDRVEELMLEERVREEAQRRLDIKSRISEASVEDLLA